MNIIVIISGIQLTLAIILIIMVMLEMKQTPKNVFLTHKEEHEVLDILSNSYAFNNNVMVGYIKTLSETSARQNIKQIINNDLGGKDNNDQLTSMIIEKIKIFHSSQPTVS